MNLPRELKGRINRLAHNAGLIHAEQTKTRLMAEIEQRVTNGATFEELKAHLDGTDGARQGCLESDPP